MATKALTKVKTADKTAAAKTAESLIRQSVMLAIKDAEKVAGIQSVSLGNEERMSSGNLALDLVAGNGGLAPGMYTFSGGEQSAKTTTALVIVAASLGQDVSVRGLWDAEGSSGSSTDYISNIMSTVSGNKKLSMEHLFGVKNTKGDYIVEPAVYYQDTSVLIEFFDWLAAFLRRLPTKRYEDGRWWYIYPITDDNKARFKDIIDIGRSKLAKKLYIPAESGAPQAIFVLDSWASLLPEGMDQDEVKGAMALLAREFAQHLPRVKGKLRSKRVILIGTNQLREKPGFVMGDNRYEAAGNALKFYSDVRIWHTARALSGVPYNPKGKGQFEEEPSVEVEGGTDKYRYVHILARKNKLGVPNRESWLRIWVSDANGQARGLDPVFDVFHVLYITNQLTGTRSKMKLNITGLGEAAANINWEQFKCLVIGTREQRDEVLEKLGYKKGINLRAGIFSQSRKGALEKMYVKATLQKRGAVEDKTSETALLALKSDSDEEDGEE